MANEFVARNGVIALNSSQVSGSLSVLNNVTASNALIAGTITAQTLLVQNVCSDVTWLLQNGCCFFKNYKDLSKNKISVKKNFSLVFLPCSPGLDDWNNKILY